MFEDMGMNDVKSYVKHHFSNELSYIRSLGYDLRLEYWSDENQLYKRILICEYEQKTAHIPFDFSRMAKECERRKSLILEMLNELERKNGILKKRHRW